MKIGILTFHSQLNYGGVLQCWALQTALERMGHEVVVIDRWLNDDNYFLERGYEKFTTKQWIMFAIRSLLGLGDISQWLRVRRTKKFLRKNIKRTEYHFAEWKDAPKNLGIDVLVVGSDQVWHCGDWGDPSAYLLEGAPRIPAISYAASFGMAELPQEFVELYKRGLSRFKAISCREREGVDICRSLGFDAVHVVDPTLLAWSDCAEERAKEPKKRELVCYFLSENIENYFDTLDAFARTHDCKVKVFMGKVSLMAFPSSIAQIKKLLTIYKRRFLSRVEIMCSAGPEEFFKAFHSAQWVISDSFHALMFSVCNGCNARIIRPNSETRRRMFARVEEFSAHLKGPLIAESLYAALESFGKGESISFDYDWIGRCCEESAVWLANNLI